MTRTILIGMGEVGRAHFNVLRKVYGDNLYTKDKDDQLYDSNGNKWYANGKTFDIMLIATQCDPGHMEPFYKMVEGYANEYQPKVIDVLTTTPCGACDVIQERLIEIQVNRSSIRGMHPNLDKFLYDIPKHIGGPARDELKAYYEGAGIDCVTHEKARAVELSHVLNNFIYGINVIAADECAKYCRDNGVDYMEFLGYRKTNNSGFMKAGYPSKVSPILYPSGGQVGGHCVTYAPTTIPEDRRGPLAKILADYNKPKP